MRRAEMTSRERKRTFDFFKARTGAKRYYHTDGAIYSKISKRQPGREKAGMGE